MLKRLLILAGAALVVAVILVAGYYQNYDTGSEGYDIKCTQPSEPPSAEASLKCEMRPRQDTELGKSSSRWWHKLLAWPEGITAWLLLLTLAVITWQAWVTRRQAEYMGKQTWILKQSADIGRGATVPTLRMLKFSLSGSDPLVDNEMELTVRNYGATPAILDALYISFDDGERWPAAEGASVAYDDRAGRAVAANSEGALHCSPTICLVSPRLIPRFRTELKHLFVHGRLKYLDVFESPVRSLRFDVCLSPRQNGTIHCEIIGQWNEYETPRKAN
jgi:hypothetical protein